TPSSPGSYTVYVNVTDNVGSRVKSNTATIIVNAALSVGILPTSATLDVGQHQLFTLNVSGGTSPYSYQWYINGTAVSGATNTTWTFAPSSTGSYKIYVKVTDASRAQATSNIATITVIPAIPEFPSYLILPLLVLATLMAAIALKRKRNLTQ
ncbi:MAG TPA: PKD domain-containing protein, partial [Candidatus Bathyarchaeia archaeon]|nr:PKD domain-containing protein [Candidatus Bathyarchaeia archaeon]